MLIIKTTKCSYLAVREDMLLSGLGEVIRALLPCMHIVDCHNVSCSLKAPTLHCQGLLFFIQLHADTQSLLRGCCGVGYLLVTSHSLPVTYMQHAYWLQTAVLTLPVAAAAHWLQAAFWFLQDCKAYPPVIWYNHPPTPHTISTQGTEICDGSHVPPHVPLNHSDCLFMAWFYNSWVFTSIDINWYLKVENWYLSGDL